MQLLRKNLQVTADGCSSDDSGASSNPEKSNEGSRLGSMT
jgi:hypothetical protein